jgi:hypothetical protein
MQCSYKSPLFGVREVWQLTCSLEFNVLTRFMMYGVNVYGYATLNRRWSIRFVRWCWQEYGWNLTEQPKTKQLTFLLMFSLWECWISTVRDREEFWLRNRCAWEHIVARWQNADQVVVLRFKSNLSVFYAVFFACHNTLLCAFAFTCNRNAFQERT